jgi:hypothetical protein
MTGDGLGKANGRSSSDVLKRRGVVLPAAGLHGMVVCEMRRSAGCVAAAAGGLGISSMAAVDLFLARVGHWLEGVFVMKQVNKTDSLFYIVVLDATTPKPPPL